MGVVPPSNCRSTGGSTNVRQVQLRHGLQSTAMKKQTLFLNTVVLYDFWTYNSWTAADVPDLLKFAYTLGHVLQPKRKGLHMLHAYHFLMKSATPVQVSS